MSSTLFEFQQDSLPEKSNEWYTPSRYVDAARRVMDGRIDLDPASCAAANQVVKATSYYSKEDNGLAHSWYGNIWLNPPYGRSSRMQGERKSTIGLFIEKLLHEYEAGNVQQAIALVTTEVNAKWFYPLWQFPICFPDHRVKFIVPAQLRKYSQMFGTCFVYLGAKSEAFIEVFSQFGMIAKCVSTPKPQMKMLPLWREEGRDE